MPSWLKRHWPELLIALFAIYSRFVGLNWDNNHHLHPDERFLTMTQLALKIPTSWSNYFDPTTSTLNPHNQGQNFFVYGTLPLTVNKFLAVFANTDTYNQTTLQGRFLSGVFDLGTSILVYQLAWTLFTKKPLDKRRQIARLAAASYVLAVLPIQLAHYFAVDSFLTFFLTLTLLQLVKYSLQPSWKRLILSGVAFGLALACKVSGVLLLPLAVTLLAGTQYHGMFHVDSKKRWQAWKTVGAALLCWGLSVYLVIRIGSPNYFASASFFDPRLNSQFAQNLTALKSFEGAETWFPPAIQWISKPKIWFSATNLTLFGFGVIVTSMAIIGSFLVAATALKRKNWSAHWQWYALLSWCVLFFLYQSSQFVQAIRYFIIMYPFLAILAGLGWQKVLEWCALSRLTPISCGIVSLTALVWPLAFLSIYQQPHSRVTASAWIYNNIPSHSLILSEYWDDALPLSLQKQTKTFMSKNLYVFDQDTMEKWFLLNSQLKQADYYILSSNRAWASIMAVPDKYPRMSAFYQDLFTGNTEYELVATFTSYPSLRYLGIPIDFPTDGADESFTVYDHPKVLVFFNRQSTRRPEMVGFGSAIQK